MEKSRDAFRTISEVAEWLDVPTHVLRFWESRFAQIKPVKRAGGRRYYRPSDMRIIGGVKALLHDQGMTIRGVQRLFREQGVKHVSSFSPLLYDEDGEAIIDAVDVTPAEEAESPTQVAEPVPGVAEPAPVARATHGASPVEPEPESEPEITEAEAIEPAPEPEIADTPIEPAVEDIGGSNQPDMFPETQVEAPPAVEEELVLVEDDTAAAAAAPIDVSDTDPADDDTAFASGLGPSARLILLPRRKLHAHLDAIRASASRLSEIRDRME